MNFGDFMTGWMQDHDVSMGDLDCFVMQEVQLQYYELYPDERHVSDGSDPF